MKLYRVTKTCFWGPQPGAETLHHKGEELYLHGTERNIGEFFEPVSVEEPTAPDAPQPKKPGPRPKKPSVVEDLNDL